MPLVVREAVRGLTGLPGSPSGAGEGSAAAFGLRCAVGRSCRWREPRASARRARSGSAESAFSKPAGTVAVTLRRVDNDQSLDVDILGPWDSDIDSRIFSYRTGLAQELLGKAVGETVEIRLAGQEGEYRIEALGKAVDRLAPASSRQES